MSGQTSPDGDEVIVHPDARLSPVAVYGYGVHAATKSPDSPMSTTEIGGTGYVDVVAGIVAVDAPPPTSSNAWTDTR